MKPCSAVRPRLGLAESAVAAAGKPSCGCRFPVPERGGYIEVEADLHPTPFCRACYASLALFVGN